MKKFFNIAITAFALIILSVSCAKELNTENEIIDPIDPQETVVPTGKVVTISATISEDLATKVSFAATYSGGKPQSMALTWAEGDKLRVYNHDDKTKYEDFTLEASSIGQTQGSFSGSDTKLSGATSYDVEIVNGEVNYAEQTQPSDGVTSGLKYLASASGINDYTDITFTSFSSVLAITAKMPSTAVAAAIKSVDITAMKPGASGEEAANIFNGGNTLTITLTTTGSSDDILNLYATLPVGNTTVPANTTLLVHFNAPSTSHTVYTRFVELGSSSLTFEANKLNTININATQSDTHAGLTSCDGTTAAKAYLIGDKYQLNSVNTILSSKANSSTTYFKLIDNIDLTGETNWVPIDCASKFIHMEGNNKVINNLKFSGGESYYPGLFGVLYGTVQNLTIDNASVSGGSKVAGILAGYLCSNNGYSIGCSINNVIIQNSSLNGNGKVCGALAGAIGQQASNSFSINISNVTVSGTTITTTNDCGGLIALAQGAASQNRTLTISQCDIINSSITSSGTNTRVGGLIGYLPSSKTTISNIDVKGTDVTGSSKATAVGGIVGFVESNASFEECTFQKNGEKTATVTGPANVATAEETVRYTGGLVGSLTGAATFDDCHVKNATVTLTGESASDEARYVGGAFGYINNASATIGETTACTVESVSITNGKHYTGGFVGYLDAGTIKKCTASGSISSAKSSVGGFAGRINSGTLYTNTTSVSVNGVANVGGFVGYANGGSFTSCTASGTVSCSGTNIGGFVGWSDGGTQYTDCTYNGTKVWSSYKPDSGAAAVNLGGFCGTIATPLTATISGCVVSEVTSGVKSENNQQRVGGFIGNVGTMNNNNTGLITRCKVHNTPVTGGRYIGGFAGVTYSNISECLVTGASTGTVTCNTSGDCGGFVGYVRYKKVTNSYTTAHVSASGKSKVGGFVGTLVATNIEYCFTQSDISWGSSGSNHGSFCGWYNSGATIKRSISWTNQSGAFAVDESDSSKGTQDNCYKKASGTYTNIKLAAEALEWSNEIWNLSGTTPLLLWHNPLSS